MSKFEEVAQKEIEQASVTYEAYQGIFKAEVPEEGLVVRSGDEILRFPWLEFAKNWHSDEELHSKVDCAIEALTEIRQSIDEYNQIYDLHTDMALLLEDIDGVAFEALEEIGGDDE